MAFHTLPQYLLHGFCAKKYLLAQKPCGKSAGIMQKDIIKARSRTKIM